MNVEPRKRKESVHMKFQRRKRMLLLFAMLVVVIYTGQSLAAQKSTQQLTNRDFIRFHVIANSDSVQDQELKLKVRDGLLRMINQQLMEYTVAQAEPRAGRVELTLEQSREYVKTHLDDIETRARQIVRTNGYDYAVTASLGARFVPEKTYGNVTFPEGDYEALNVVIGDGGGQNWWCVLFPPLCTVGAQPVDEKYDSLWEAMDSGEPVKLQLKFKSLEYLEKIIQ